MTMHLLPAYFTTTSTRSKKKSKPKKSDVEHQKWLAKRGLTPEQLKKKKRVDINWQEEYSKTIKVEKKYESLETFGSKDACAKRDIMTKLHNEPSHVRKEILDKASRVMPLYNKGGLQYVTPETDIKTVGTKSRRG
jgi:hypothetical protein